MGGCKLVAPPGAMLPAPCSPCGSPPPALTQVFTAPRHHFLWLSPDRLIRAPLPLLQQGRTVPCSAGPLSANWVLMVLAAGQGLLGLHVWAPSRLNEQHLRPPWPTCSGSAEPLTFSPCPVPETPQDRHTACSRLLKSEKHGSCSLGVQSGKRQGFVRRGPAGRQPLRNARDASQTPRDSPACVVYRAALSRSWLLSRKLMC